MDTVQSWNKLKTQSEHMIIFSCGGFNFNDRGIRLDTTDAAQKKGEEEEKLLQLMDDVATQS